MFLLLKLGEVRADIAKESGEDRHMSQPDQTEYPVHTLARPWGACLG